MRWQDVNEYPERLQGIVLIIIKHGKVVIDDGEYFSDQEIFEAIRNIAQRLYTFTYPNQVQSRHFVQICIDDRIPWMAMYVDGILVLQGYKDEVPAELVTRTLRSHIASRLQETMQDGIYHADAVMEPFDFRMTAMKLPATCPYLASELEVKTDGGA